MSIRSARLGHHQPNAQAWRPQEYFEADRDVWSMFRSIVRERIKREVEPLLATLYEIRDASPALTRPRARTRRNCSRTRSVSRRCSAS